MKSSPLKIFGPLGLGILAIASAGIAVRADGADRGRSGYAAPRNREILIFNELAETVRYAAMLINPSSGTRSANYGIEPRTTEHQVAGGLTARYEVKKGERLRVRFLEDGAEEQYSLLADHSYRLRRTEDGKIDLQAVPDAGIAVLTSRLRHDVHYEILHGGTDKPFSRSIMVTLAPGGQKYHSVAGEVECLLGLRHVRALTEPSQVTLRPGGHYEFRYDPQGRMRSEEGQWDLFAVEKKDQDQ